MKSFIFIMILSTFFFAKDIKPVMIYDTNIIMDKAWNEAIHRGITLFEKKTQIDIKEDFALNKEEFASKVTNYTKEGYSPILFNSLYKEKKELVKNIIFNYPKTRFIVFNGSYNIPNIHYFIFSNQESSFLAGYLASKKSKSKKLGFIGGMDIPLIRNFLCGYIKGAKYADPNTQIISQYVGRDSTDAWTSPDKAFSLALSQIKEGADVLFSPAGGSAIGVLKAASEKNLLAIGVDSNQNHLYPGNVLTSTLVRVDNAVFRSLIAAKREIWGDQMKVMGLQENGVGLAFDKYNKDLISKELKEEIEYLKADILLNKIDLPNYDLIKKCQHNGKILF